MAYGWCPLVEGGGAGERIFDGLSLGRPDETRSPTVIRPPQDPTESDHRRMGCSDDPEFSSQPFDSLVERRVDLPVKGVVMLVSDGHP